MHRSARRELLAGIKGHRNLLSNNIMETDTHKTDGHSLPEAWEQQIDKLRRCCECGHHPFHMHLP